MKNCWQLRGARVALGPETTARLDLGIRAGRVSFSKGRVCRRSETIELDGYMILPGLVNAHDHLDFNLFPRLGRGPYPNAGAWARDIYRPAESPVREQLRVPPYLRLMWGAVKNLLSGVTTVAHHNPLSPRLFVRHFPVRAVRQLAWAHSLEFTPDVAKRFCATPPDWPFVIHIGEGTDDVSRREIYRLAELGALDQRTVIVHAVALDRAALALVHRCGASIVWCPTSNLFLLGATLGAVTLESGIPVVLGSDSALTAQGDLLDELRAARTLGIGETELYRMVTLRAARVLRLHNGEGQIVEGGIADLLVVPDMGATPATALSELARPEMVMTGGSVNLATPEMAARLPEKGAPPFHRMDLEGRGEFLVNVETEQLGARTLRRLGTSQVLLAGRRVSHLSCASRPSQSSAQSSH